MIIFEVAGRPISWNKYYAGQHWAQRQKTADEWKWRVKAALGKFRVPKIAITAPIEIEVEVYVGRPIDCDNVVLKTYIDGLRDWGFLPNDDPRWVKKITISVTTKSKVEFTRVKITEHDLPAKV